MPIRYDGVLARSLPQFARLRIASFPMPYARIWANPGTGDGCCLLLRGGNGVPSKALILGSVVRE
jgi:hypothetical protein